MDNEKTTIYTANGCEFWHKGGRLHRIGGPAIYLEGVYENWSYCGDNHRLDGPAQIGYRTDGTTREYWWVRGENITEKVKVWIAENDLSDDWKQWDKDTWAYFRRRFS